MKPLSVMRVAGAALLALLLGACATPSGSGTTRSAASSGDSARARNARVHLELAEGYYQRGQGEVALGEVDKALQLSPDYVAAYNMKGLIEMGLGHERRADADFRQALSLAPDNGDTLHNYGWFLCSQGRYAESFTQFARALKVHGYRSAERTDLAYGVCQLRAGDVTGAEHTLRRGFALDPANPAMATNLALALHRQHRDRDALFYIARVNDAATANAQSLWLGVLIARRLGDAQRQAAWTAQLTQRFPNSQEAIAVQQGHFDDPGLLR